MKNNLHNDKTALMSEYQNQDLVFLQQEFNSCTLLLCHVMVKCEKMQTVWCDGEEAPYSQIS